MKFFKIMSKKISSKLNGKNGDNLRLSMSITTMTGDFLNIDFQKNINNSLEYINGLNNLDNRTK